MKIQLNVLERITLMELFPSIEGNFMLYKLLTTLKAELSFNEKEMKEFQFVQKKGQITWKKSVDKSFEIGDQLRDVICLKLSELDTQGRINEQIGSLFDKFQYEQYLITKETEDKIKEGKTIPLKPNSNDSCTRKM